MVERHIQHLRNRHLHLMRPSHQVCKCSSSRADNFRTNETAGAFSAYKRIWPFVYQHNAAAALVSEGNFADDKLIRLIFRCNLRVFQTDSGNLRTGEYHADYATAQTALNIRENSGIVTGNFALVGSSCSRGN